MKTRTNFPHQIAIRDPEFIPLSDGTRLAVRIWLPVDAEERPVPVTEAPVNPKANRQRLTRILRCSRRWAPQDAGHHGWVHDTTFQSFMNCDRDVRSDL